MTTRNCCQSTIPRLVSLRSNEICGTNINPTCGSINVCLFQSGCFPSNHQLFYRVFVDICSTLNSSKTCTWTCPHKYWSTTSLSYFSSHHTKVKAMQRLHAYTCTTKMYPTIPIQSTSTGTPLTCRRLYHGHLKATCTCFPLMLKLGGLITT